MTACPDMGKEGLVVHVEALGVTDLVCLIDVTADGDNEAPFLQTCANHRSVGGAGHGEIAPAIGHFDELRKQLAGHLKRAVNVPDGASAAFFGKGDGRGVEAFGHVARSVYPQKEERDAALAVALQSGESLADHFEADAKAQDDAVDVVARGFGQGQEFGVGHEQSGGEVVRQLDRKTRAARISLDAGGCDIALHGLSRFEKANDMG